MESKIIDIFPTAVMKFNINRSIKKSEMQFVTENENNLQKNTGNKFSKNTFILEHESLKEIKKFCNNCLQEYFKKINNPITNTSIYITQSWLNFTKENGYHHIHEHPNSFLSGVLYFNTTNDDSIGFQKRVYDQIHVYYKDINDYNTKEVYVKVKTGDLLIFPSSVTHFVPTIKSENVTRISLAFNSFIKGETGIKDALDYLKL